MHTRQSKFAAAVFHRLEEEHDTQQPSTPSPARRESDVWGTAQRLPMHPIDRTIRAALLKGPRVALGGREGFYGKLVLAAVSRGHPGG